MCFAYAPPPPPPRLPLFFVWCGRLCALELLCRVCAPSCPCPPWLCSVLLRVRVVLQLLAELSGVLRCPRVVRRVVCPPPPPPGRAFCRLVLCCAVLPLSWCADCCFVWCLCCVVLLRPLVLLFLCGVLCLVPWCLGLMWVVLCGPWRFSVLCCAVPVLWCRAVRCAALLCCRGLLRFCWCHAEALLRRVLWCRAALCVVPSSVVARCGVFFWAVWCSGAFCRLVCRCAVLRCCACAGFAVLFGPAPPPLPLCCCPCRALRPVLFRRVLLRVWCRVALRRCARFLPAILLCAVAFAWCRGVLLCAVLFPLAFRGVVALLCGAVRLGAVVWFAVFFCAVLVLWCLAVWCAAVLCCLWLLRFCWCLAVSCCAVLCVACLRAWGAVVCCCALWRFLCGCVLSWCTVLSGVSLCPAALCWFLLFCPALPPPPCCSPCCLPVPCVLSCFAVFCCACGAVLRCAGALVLAVLFFLCCCRCLVPWCVVVRCAVALGVLWCGGVALLCGVVCLGALVPGAVPRGGLLLRAAVVPGSAVLFLCCLWFFSLFSFKNLCCLFCPLLCGLKNKERIKTKRKQKLKCLLKTGKLDTTPQAPPTRAARSWLPTYVLPAVDGEGVTHVEVLVIAKG